MDLTSGFKVNREETFSQIPIEDNGHHRGELYDR